MRLIDADALKIVAQGKNHHRRYIWADISDAPTVEAEPVRRGKWVKDEEESANHAEPIYRCSACLNWEAWGNYECTPFCPHCGAKMEGTDA